MMGSDTRRWIEERFVPVVLVVATPDAEQVVKKSGLSTVDLLRQFQRFPRDVHTRTIKEDVTYPIKNFSVRIHTPSDLRNVHEEKRHSYFQHVVSTSTPNQTPQLQNVLQAIARAPDSSHPELNQAQTVELRESASVGWFETFRQEYVHSCRFNYWETLDHPTAVLLVTSTNTPQPVQVLNTLLSEQTQQIFQLYCVDAAQLYKMCVVVHDASKGPPQATVENVFAEVKRGFGVMDSKLLTLNSDLTPRHPTTAWPNRTIPIDSWCCEDQIDYKQDLGDVLLTDAEVDATRTIVHDLIERGLLHSMERRIKTLHSAVTQKGKKTIKIMNWVLGKDDNKESNNESGKFGLETYESQLRRLADLLFLLRDYQQAGSYYKQLKGELTSPTPVPTNVPYLAACHEAIGLCLWLQGRGTAAPSGGHSIGNMLSTKKDTDSNMESAYNLYLKVNRTDYAIRVSLMLYNINKMRAGIRTTDITLRAANVDDKGALYSAMFLEQSALCFLSASPTCQSRKFALFICMAGMKYQQAGQIQQAIRCHRLAAILYRKKKWSQINDNITSTLAGLYEQLGSVEDLSMAVKYTRRFIRTCDRPQQGEFLQGFCSLLSSYLKATDQTVVHNFRIPLISTQQHVGPIQSQATVTDNDLKVNLYGNYNGPSVTLAPLDGLGMTKEEDNLWKAMQATATKGLKLHQAYTAKDPTAIVREKIVVDLVLQNPLNVAIQITDLTLMLHFEADPESQEAGCGQACKSSVVEQLHLNPHGQASVQMDFTVYQQGKVTVTGVEWVLSNTVKGCKYFGDVPIAVQNLLKELRKKKQERRKSQMEQEGTAIGYEDDSDDEDGLTGNSTSGGGSVSGGVQSPRTNDQVTTPRASPIVANVTPPMPRLEATLSPSPPTLMLNGEVHKCSLELCNTGTTTATNISITYTHPNNFVMAHSSIYDGQPQSGKDHEILRLEDVSIKPDKCIKLVTYVHTNKISRFNIYISIAYSNEKGEAYRIFRCLLPMNVVPSLQLRPFCLVPSPTTPTNYMLALEMHNSRRANSNVPAVLQNNVGNGVPQPRFHITQLSCISQLWDVQPVNLPTLHENTARKPTCSNPDDNNIGVFGVDQNQSVVMYFKVTHKGNNVGDNNNSSMRMGGSSSSERQPPTTTTIIDDHFVSHSHFVYSHASSCNRPSPTDATPLPPDTSDTVGGDATRLDKWLQRHNAVWGPDTDTDLIVDQWIPKSAPPSATKNDIMVTGDGSGSSSGDIMDTSVWPISHFLNATCISPSATPPPPTKKPSQNRTTTSSRTTSPPTAGEQIFSHPLLFYCSWLTESEGNNIASGHCSCVVVPYEWKKGWSPDNTAFCQTDIPFGWMRVSFERLSLKALLPRHPKEAKPITVQLSYPNHLCHNFTRTNTITSDMHTQRRGNMKPLLVDIQMVITNKSNKPLQLLLMLKKHPHDAYVWQGKGKRCIADLEHGGTATVSFTANVFGYGMHDFNSFTILDANDNSPIFSDQTTQHCWCRVDPD